MTADLEDGRNGLLFPDWEEEEEEQVKPRVPALWAAMQMADEHESDLAIEDALKTAEHTKRRAWLDRDPLNAAEMKAHRPDEWRTWEESNRGRARVATALARSHVIELSEGGGVTASGIPRVGVIETVLLATDDERYSQVVPHGREVRHDWTADPQQRAAKLASCSSGEGVHQTVDENGQKRWGTHAIHCGKHQICPMCGHYHAAEEVSCWLPAISALVREGHQVVHATFTQRTSEDQLSMLPVIITDDEWRRGYRPARGHRRAKPGETGTASCGLDLGHCIGVLRGAWRAMSENRGMRRRRDRLFSGSLGSLEWTGHRKLGGKKRSKLAFTIKVVRWHAHLHVLLIIDPDVHIPVDEEGYAIHPLDHDKLEECGYKAEDCGWWGDLCDLWLEAIGQQDDASAGWEGQKARLIGATGGRKDDVEGALREVIKYPFKPAEMTDAQICEAVATVVGAHLRTRGGMLHASSKVAKVATKVAKGEVTQESVADLFPPRMAERVRVRSASLLASWEEDEKPKPKPVYRREGLLAGQKAPDRIQRRKVQTLPDLPPVVMEEVVKGSVVQDQRPPGPVMGWVLLTGRDMRIILDSSSLPNTIEVATYDPDEARMVDVRSEDVRAMMDDCRKAPRRSSKPRGEHDNARDGDGLPLVDVGGGAGVDWEDGAGPGGDRASPAVRDLLDVGW